MNNYVWGNQETQFFFQLTPEIVLDAIAELGLDVTGRCLTLNSMENRVYEIEVDSSEGFPNNAVVAKFYRPGRWSEEQIREEHQFLKELDDDEIPVIAPLSFSGETLFTLKNHKILYTLFPKKGGRAPDEMNKEQLEILGRMLARLHNVGSLKKSESRIQITPESFGLQNLNFLLENDYIPNHIKSDYQQVVEDICSSASPLFKDITNIRIHGDCHIGNIISRPDEGLFFIDFDDMLFGPAVQDIWLLTPGYDEYAINDRNTLIDSYETMRDFDHRELKLVEILRSLRFIHFSAWIAKRWEDPAFKIAFSHFGQPQYWEIQLNDLRRQKDLINKALNPTPSYY